MIFLRSFSSRSPTLDDEAFPLSLPVLRSLRVELRSPVAFFVGENGTGKSTVLEALALAAGCVAVGSDDLDRDPTLEPARRLADHLRLVRARQPRTKLFFRAEDAFGFTKRVVREAALLAQLEEDFRQQFADGSLAQTLAVGAARGQRQAFSARYGEDPDAFSHGESFLHLLQERVRPQGLYFLDEPETPLSPVRQLALLSLLKDRAGAGCQFVIATHSPLLMAYPRAQILSFDDGTVSEVEYDEVEHVVLMRSFLRRPESYLRRL